MNDAPHSSLLPQRRVVAVAAVTAATTTVSFDGSIPNVALPTIARELGVPGSSAVSIVAAYQIVLMMTLLPLAALAQRIGHRRMLRIGIVEFIVGGVACAPCRR